MGVVVGVLSRRVLPKMSTTGAMFSVLIAVIGGVCGGFFSALIGGGAGLIPNLILAAAGSLVVMFFYREYLVDVVGQ